MASRRDNSAVFAPNLGVYYDRPKLAIDPRALSDALNVRVRDGTLVRDNMGWGPFPNSDSALDLVDPVLGIDAFFPREGGQFLLFCTTKDVYLYVEATESVVYLTPRYATGTVSVTNGVAAVTGSGTAWLANAKAGDFLHVGDGAQVDPSEEWLEIDAVVSDTEITLVAGFPGTTDSGLDYTIRKTFTGTLLDPWLFETFPSAVDVGGGADGDRWYATNGVDPVIAWHNGLDEVYLPSIGLDSAKWIRRFSNLMVYGDITVSSERRPFSIRTSDLSKPEDTSNGLAAEFVVHDGVDPLVAAQPLGDGLVIYAERSITLAQFVGDPFVFVFRRAISGVGPLARRAVVDFGDYHEFLGNDAQYRFDGIRVDEIGSHVWRDVIRRHSPQRTQMVLTHFDEESGEVLWVVPLNTDASPEEGPPERAFTEHYLEAVGERTPRPFMVRQLPATATGYFERELTLTWDQMIEMWSEINFRWNDQFLQAAFPFNLFGTATGEVFILNSQDSQNGDPFAAFVRFGRRPLGDIRTKGTLRRLYPLARKVEGDLTVTVHGSRDASGPTAPAGIFPFSMDMAEANHFVSPRLTTRYVEVEFGTQGVSRPFFLEGYDLDVVRAGER